MSRENVELVKRAYSAVAERPEPDWETANRLFHRDHVWVPAGVGESPVEGRGAYRDWLSAQGDVLSWEADLEGAVDVGSRTVLVVLTMRARGTSSGVDVDQRMWFLATVGDGKVVRSAAFTDPAEAMRAALEE